MHLISGRHLAGRISTRAIVVSSLSGVLVLGAFLRFFQIGHDSLWTDEGFSVRLAKTSSSAFLQQTTSVDPNPPLYYVLLRGWMSVFGDSESALRSLSAVFGIALLYVVYELGRSLGGSRVGITAALFTAVSEFLVHYSQEARGYALLVLLTALSYLLLLRLLDRWSLWTAVGYAVATTALLYTHDYGFFVLAAQAGFLVIKVVRWPAEPDRTRHEMVLWGTLLAVPFVLTIPWLVVFAGHVRSEVEGASNAKLGWLDPPHLRDLPGAFSGYAGSPLALAVIFGLAGCAAFMAVRRSTPGTGRAIAVVTRRLVDDRNTVLLVLWLIVPIVLPFVLSLVVTPFYQFKYTIPAALAFYLLVALGIDTLGGTLRLAAAALVAVAFLIATAQYYSDYRTEEWREASAFLADRVLPDDLSVFESDVGQKNAFAYYWTRPDIEQLAGTRFAGLFGQDLARVNAASARHKRVWLVVSHSRDPEGRLRAAIEQAHGLRSENDFLGIEILRFG